MENEIAIEFYTKAKSFFNDKRHSDCSFLVGESKSPFYAHKFILSMSSDVFSSMFYGDLKEKEMPINIPDLTAVGFENLLNYEIHFPLSELYETYMAADKYLVTSLTSKFIGYIKSILNESNCCLIYDQLIKINKDEESLDHIRKMIKMKGKIAFDNEYFVKISEETLTDILMMESFPINEIDILKACSKWIDNQVKRKNLELTADNKREEFKKIRHLIDFSDIKTDDLKNFEEINNLLNSQEIGQLLLSYLFPNNYSYPFKCEATKRKNLKIFTIKGPGINNSRNAIFFEGFRSRESFTLESNREILILNILTSFSQDITNLELFVEENDLPLNLKMIRKGTDGYWKFEFNDYLRINPNNIYNFRFKFDKKYFPANNNGRTKSILKLEDSDAILVTLDYRYIPCINAISFYSII